jgi:CrcB protein
VLAVISAGGALGAVARYGLSLAVPYGHAGFPWPTFAVNVTGCLAIGVFMVAITEAFAAHRLLRPFVGVGVLGGYTTFSTYTVDGLRLLRDGDYRIALLYLIGTMLACLLAVVLGVVVARRMFRWVEHAKERR